MAAHGGGKGCPVCREIVFVVLCKYLLVSTAFFQFVSRGKDGRLRTDVKSIKLYGSKGSQSNIDIARRSKKIPHRRCKSTR